MRQQIISLVTACVSVTALFFSVWTTKNTYEISQRSSEQERIKAERVESTEALKSLASNQAPIFGSLTADEWKIIFQNLKQRDEKNPRAFIIQAYEAVDQYRVEQRTKLAASSDQASLKNAASAKTSSEPSPAPEPTVEKTDSKVQSLLPTDGPPVNPSILSGVLIYPQCPVGFIDGSPERKKWLEKLNDAVKARGGVVQPWQTVAGRIRRSLVRYYRDEDKEQAEELRNVLNSVDPSVSFDVERNTNPALAERVERAMIEIWVATANQ